MKVDQIRQILSAQQAALDSAGATNADKGPGALSRALEPFARDTTAGLCKKLDRVAKAGKLAPDAMGHVPVSTMLPQVDRLAHVLDTAGAKPAAKDLKLLAASLSQLGDVSLERICSEALAGPKPKAASSAPRTPKAEPLGPAEIRELSDRLTATNAEDQAFRQVMAGLKSRKLGKAEIYAIANAFLGREKGAGYKSIAEAFKKIEERHVLDAISESRGRAINRINA